MNDVAPALQASRSVSSAKPAGRETKTMREIRSRVASNGCTRPVCQPYREYIGCDNRNMNVFLGFCRTTTVQGAYYTSQAPTECRCFGPEVRNMTAAERKCDMVNDAIADLLDRSERAQPEATTNTECE